jgi:hypothetical protein
VSFPQWNGYRVVHDPVYTAYSSFEIPSDETQEFNPGGLILLLLIVVMVVVVVAVVASRRKKGV